MAQTKYMSDSSLILYDQLIKAWVREQVDSIPVITPVYDEENRILEFSLSGSSTGSLTFTDDGAGNVTVALLSMSDDGAGNVSVVGFNNSNDGNGNVFIS